MRIILFLWRYGSILMIFAGVVLGIRISRKVNNFTFISRPMLKELIPQILSNPMNLYRLLCLRECREYGIHRIFAEACRDWPLSTWKIVEKLVEDHPKLASVLVSVKCLKFFRSIVTPTRVFEDPTLLTRYGFAKRLSSLPVILDNAHNVRLFLENFRLIDATERNSWLYRNPLSKIIDMVYISQDILDSGLTSLFLIRGVFDDPQKRGKYLDMLKKLTSPLDLACHAVRLNNDLEHIKKDIERKYQRPDWIKQSLVDAIETIEKTLPKLMSKRAYDSRPAETLFRLLYSTPQEEIENQRETINLKLANIEVLKFYQLVAIIQSKLRANCRQFLSEDNRKRLVNEAIRFSHKSVCGSCLYREEYFGFFYRWHQSLPRNSHFTVSRMSKARKFLQSNFYFLPPIVNNGYLRNFLEDVARLSSKNATKELIVRRRQIFSCITCIHSDSEMSENTSDYLLASLARQMYFGIPEVFEQKLLDWIDAVAERKSISKTVIVIKDIITNLYPPTIPDDDPCRKDEGFGNSCKHL